MTNEGKLLIVGIIIVLAGGGWYWMHRDTVEMQTGDSKIVATSTTAQPFVIDGTPVTLINGVSIVKATPDSASSVTTKYFGNEVKADFNNDGIQDSAFLVTQNAGGSGTYYYVATSLGGPALVLGDRIAPQSTELVNGKIVVNYADRKAGEPMTTSPSVGMSRYFVWSEGELHEVESSTSTATSWREEN